MACIHSYYYIFEVKRNDGVTVQYYLPTSRGSKMNDEERIAELESRISSLENEVSELKKIIHAPKQTPTANTRVDTSYSGRISQGTYVQTQISPSTSVANESPIPAMPQATARTVANTTSPASARTVASSKVPASTKSLEDRIGRNVMGIAASVLVFLGIILLGVIIYDYLNEWVKLIAMYVISLVPAVIGLIKMNKSEKYKSFFTTLAGCGMGALYISFILTHYAFGVINEIVLVLLLLIWTLFTAYLSRIRSEIFVYVCYAGLTISTFLCATKWEGFPISLIFYGLGIGVLFFINKQKEYNKNAFYFIQLPIVAILLTFIYNDSPIIRLVILLIPIAALFIQNICFELTPENNSVLIPTTVLTFVLASISMLIMYYDMDTDLVKYAFTLIFIIISAFYFYVHEKGANNKAPFLVAYYFTAVMMLFTFEAWLWIPACLLLIGGFLLKEDHFKYVGYVYVLLCISDPSSLYPSKIMEDQNLTVLVILAAILIISILIGKIVSQDSTYTKIDKYIQTVLLFFIPIAMKSNDILDSSLTLLLLTVITILSNNKAYYTDSETGLTAMPSRIIGLVLNGLVMLFTLFALGTTAENLHIIRELYGTEWLATTLLIVIGVIVFLLNTVSLFNLKLPEMVTGVYICLKLTILLIVILNRFDAAGFLISIVCLLLAVASIVLGFSLKRKPFRLYGLVLSLICVAKLILVDISYSTSLLRPIGFMAAGALCFGISWIYSRIEKKENAEEIEHRTDDPE